MKLNKVVETIEANDVNLAGSTFHDVNLSGSSIHNANMSGVTIDDVNLSGLTVLMQTSPMPRLRVFGLMALESVAY